MPVVLRPSLNQDFVCCKRLYFGEMQWIIEQLHLDKAAQEISFQQQWDPTQVRITLDDAGIGWLQTIPKEDGLFCCTDVCGPPVSAEGYRHEGDEAVDCRGRAHRALNAFG